MPVLREVLASEAPRYDSILTYATVLALMAIDTPAAHAEIDRVRTEPGFRPLWVFSYARHWDVHPALAAAYVTRHPPVGGGDLEVALAIEPAEGGARTMKLTYRNRGRERLALDGNDVYPALKLLAIGADGSPSVGDISAIYRIPTGNVRSLDPGREVTVEELCRVGKTPEAPSCAARWRAERSLLFRDSYLPLRGRGPWRIRAVVYEPPRPEPDPTPPEAGQGRHWTGTAISEPVTFR